MTISETSDPEPRGGPRDRPSALATAAVVGVVAVAGALSPVHPTGTGPADAVWAGGFAGLVALAGSRSRSGALMWLTAIGALTAVSGSAGAIALGIAGLAGTVVLVAWGRRPAPATAAVAGLGALALLWGPTYGPNGLPSLVAAAATVPVLWQGWRALGRVGRRRSVLVAAAVALSMVAASALAGLVALSVRTQLTDAAQNARDGLALVRDGEVDEAEPALQSSADGFASSADSLNGVLALPGRFVPVVGPHVEALRRVSAAGEELATAATAAAQEADYESLRSEGGRIDLVRLDAMQVPVERSLEAARHAQEVVDDVRSPWLVGPLADKLDELDAELDDTVPSAELASRALAVAPSMLGQDGTVRYLLQFATPAESRAAGGYVGTFGLMTATDGLLDLALTGATEDLNVPLGQEPFAFDPPPGWQELYSSFRVQRFPGNLTADPDWPTDAGVARQIYAQVPAVGEVAGVLYADPTALAALLAVTGPVEVPGLDVALDSSNVEQYLLVDQYSRFNSDDDATNLARRQVLGDVVSAVFDALSTRELPGLGTVFDALGSAVAGGHLKLASFDESAEALFDETGLSGAWDPTADADYLSIRSTDLLSNKIDSFLRRQVEVEVEQSGSTLRSVVTLTVTNTAPATGLPDYVIGNTVDLPAGTSRNSYAIYSPLSLEGATLDGTAVGPQQQVYADGYVFSFPFRLDPGQTRTLVVTLTGSTRGPGAYHLDLVPQPLATPDEVLVTLRGGTAATTLFEGPLERQTLVIAPQN